MFRINYCDGTAENQPTYALALASVAGLYDPCELGHEGDISDGGKRTLCWSRDETGEPYACASIREVG